MISNIDYNRRIACDVDVYITTLMKAVRDGWTPPENYSERDYNAAKEYSKIQSPPTGLGTYPDEVIGFLGYGCSFGGKWFGGFARGGENSGKPRNHVAESSRNLVKMRPKLQGIDIYTANYLDSVSGSLNVIYCDPPYSTGTQYKNKFNHTEFWSWVRGISTNNYVYVSEYNAPDDFVAIWSKEHKSGIDNKAVKHKQTIEKLFVLKGSKADEQRS